MTQDYLKQLIAEIKGSEAVKEQPRLKSEDWNTSSYTLLSKVIKDKLKEKLNANQLNEVGHTLSYKTLEKIFTGKYRLSIPIDNRSINTLNKLAIFIDYTDWDAFMITYNKKLKLSLKTATDEDAVLLTVRSAIQTEFATYVSIPAFDADTLKKSYTKNAGALKRIEEVVHIKTEASEIISNDFNPSTVDILDIKLLNLTAKTAKVRTEEFWTLCWYNNQENQYIHRYMSKTEHIYILKKNRNHWKIQTNAFTDDILWFNKK